MEVSNQALNKVWYEIAYPFPNLTDFFHHFVMDVITYPFWDYN